MNLTVILGAMAMVGAIGVFWWGLTARPSQARANLFAGLPQPAAAPSKSAARSCASVGQTARRLLPNPLVDGLEVKLVQAGHPYGLDLPRLLGIKITRGRWSGGVPADPRRSAAVRLLVAAALLFFLPDYWVLSVRDKRQDAMQARAADIIDQLTICVEAGLGFDAALARVATTTEGPLTDELRHTISDIQAGVPRAQALRTLADRAQILEIRQLVTALLQAQKHGVPMAETLRIQSAEMRLKRKQRRGEGGQADRQDLPPDRRVLHAGLLHRGVRAGRRQLRQVDRARCSARRELAGGLWGLPAGASVVPAAMPGPRRCQPDRRRSQTPAPEAALGVDHLSGHARRRRLEASHATTAAASSGVFHRPRGNARPTDSVSSAEAQPVSVGPGFTALTVMPRSASASASVAVI